MAWSVEKKHGNLPRRRPEDPFERIWAHYHDLTIDVVLSEGEKERVEIYNHAYDQYVKGFSHGEIAKEIMVIFGEKRDKSIPMRTAYNYVHESVDLFGSITQIDLSREKIIFLERCKYAMRKCENEGNWTAWATINQTYAKVANFNEVSDELTEYLKKFKAFVIVLSSDPKALELEAAELVEDVFFEEMEEDGTEEGA